MRHMKHVGVLAGMLIVGVFVAFAAQAQMSGMQMEAQAGQQQPPMGPGMMGMPMSGMMCPMMGGGMRGGTMGMMSMMGGGQTDPKTMGRMLQMRGEMMKAVGDVLIKHGKGLESAK